MFSVFILAMALLLMPNASVAQSGNTSLVFTNASATGRTGPTQSQLNTAYSGTDLSGNVTIITQGFQEWTVPYTGTYSIQALSSITRTGD